VKIHLHLTFGNVPFVIPCELSDLAIYALSDIKEKAIALASVNPDREVHWSLDRGVYIV